MTPTNKQAAESKCVMGCMHYDGGEIKHHKNCPYYPDSLTKYNDDLQNQLREENGRLREEIRLMKIANEHP